ncbi:MAG: Gfo/Idh/MocA family oxidoreductase [Oscillospiraceae bacterium]|nr:Gfo/Idh/MocA family oxidoreductase [Oscillospiraceae bacterium]
MKKKFRMGIIGCGNIATWHIYGIMDSPDLEVGALCDILPNKLEEKKQQCGATDDMCYDNYIKMLDSGKIDAVSICTPNYLHFEMAMEAVKRNIPYAVEKPVCNSHEEAAILLEETTKKNIPNMVCFSYRFKSAARYARDLVQNGTLGNIYQISGEYFQAWGLPNPKTGAVTPLNWRFIKEQSITGALGDLGCHMIDLIRFITGREFTRVTADYDTFIHKRPIPGNDGSLGDVTVDDYVNIAGQLDGPVAANLSISRYAYSRGNYQRIEIYGDNGAIRYTLEDKDELEINIGNDPMKHSHIWCTVPTPGRFNSAQMQSFADILNGCGDGLAANMTDGWQTQRVIDAAVAAGSNIIKL